MQCVLCGNGVQANEVPYVIPKGYAHSTCVQMDGRSPAEIADAMTCCAARDVLVRLFAGSVVEIREGVPEDEAWVLNHRTKTLQRYRILPRGPVVVQRLPPPFNERGNPSEATILNPDAPPDDHPTPGRSVGRGTGGRGEDEQQCGGRDTDTPGEGVPTEAL